VKTIYTHKASSRRSSSPSLSDGQFWLPPDDPAKGLDPQPEELMAEQVMPKVNAALKE